MNPLYRALFTLIICQMISFDVSALNNHDLDQPRSVEIFIVKREELGEKEINFEGEKEGT